MDLNEEGFSVSVIARAIVYLSSLYAAYLFFAREPPSSKTRTSAPRNSSRALISGDDSSSLSTGARIEKDKSELVSRHSLPTKPAARLSCVPFNGPGARTQAGMSIDAINGNVIIHGGDSNTLLRDVHIFDIDKLEWDQYPFTPNERHQFGMVAISNGVSVVFGGLDKSQRASDTLNTIAFHSKGFDWKDHDSATHKPWPSARYGHAMCLCEDKKVAMFGGYDSAGNQLSDLWLLNTNVSHEDPLWKQVAPKGYTRPKPRKSPSIAHLKRQVFLFGQTFQSRGEVELLNLSNHKLERQVTCGEEPFEQDCQVHPLENAMKLVTVSNKESSSCGMFNRIDTLDVITTPMTWSRVDLDWHGDHTMIPGTRVCFASTMDSSAGLLYIFGGTQGSYHNEEEELLSTLIVANFLRHYASEDMDG